MQKKININLVDISSFKYSYNNPKKAWLYLFESIKNINQNFKKNEITPDEITEVLEIDNSKNTIPDHNSVENIRTAFKRVKNEYKISSNSHMFLEFDRLSAVYYFSIGVIESAFEILNQIIYSINESIETTKDNLDVSLLCIKDCVKLNLASIQFWQQNFEEAKTLIEEVLTFYETFDDELYLIKMSNFISVSLCYLSWYYVKKDEFEDGEKCFFHALKVLSTVKNYTAHSGDPNFIYTNNKKIFIYDQLINFYSFQGKYDLVKEPIQQILIIMENPNFTYNIDITPINHVYFLLSAGLIELKYYEYTDFEVIIVYFSSILKLYFKYSEAFEPLSSGFFKLYFKVLDLLKLNRGPVLYKLVKKVSKEFKKNLDELADSIDEILGRFDSDGLLSFNLHHTSSIIDLIVNLSKFQQNLQPRENIFNYFTFIFEKYEKKNMPIEMGRMIEVNEESLIDIASEQMLFKYSLIINDLIDSKYISSGIVLKSKAGFLHIEDDEINLYLIQRFSARIKEHQLYMNTKEDNGEENKEKSAEYDYIVNLITPKLIETKFAPLYYKRIKYRLGKGGRSFNLPLYFGIINILYSMKLYIPLIEMLSILIDNLEPLCRNFYNNMDNIISEGLINLYEFMILIQVEVLIKINHYDRAVFELYKMITPSNEVNLIFHRIYLSLALLNTYYYDLSNFYLGEFFNTVDNMIRKDPNKFVNKNKEENENLVEETYLDEVKIMFYVAEELLNINIKKIKIQDNMKKEKIKNKEANNPILNCYTCKLNKTLTTVCLNCRKAFYCSSQCCNSNKIIHRFICSIYINFNPLIDTLNRALKENYDTRHNELEKISQKDDEDD